MRCCCMSTVFQVPLDMRTCAGAGVALYGHDGPFPEGLLLHRLFEDMLTRRGSEVGEQV